MFIERVVVREEEGGGGSRAIKENWDSNCAWLWLLRLPQTVKRTSPEYPLFVFLSSLTIEVQDYYYKLKECVANYGNRFKECVNSKRMRSVPELWPE